MSRIDIIAELRAQADNAPGRFYIYELHGRAADEIERLRKWNAEMMEKAASGGTLDGYREMGAALAAKNAEIAALKAGRDAWRDAAQSATPGGSEFTEPHEVRAHIARRRSDLVEAKKARVRAERERDALREALREASVGVREIAAERQRQIEAEGWTPEHDDAHLDHSLARAAACYALGSKLNWPASWDDRWWKPSENRRRNLVKAGALIAAEIDRLDRAALRGGDDG